MCKSKNTIITQANLQRSPDALHELERIMIKDEISIALVQETTYLTVGIRKFFNVFIQKVLVDRVPSFW